MNQITSLLIKGRTIRWTVLDEDESGAPRCVSKSVVLDIDEQAASEPAALAAAIANQCPTLHGEVVLSVAPDQALMRVIELPTADPAEIEGMIQLQADKLSPFPGDKMATSREVLKSTESSCRALIITVRRAVVDFLGDVCRKVGLKIVRIDADVMAWWRVFLDAGSVVAAGRQVMVLLDPDGGAIMASEDGSPVSFKPLGAASGVEDAEYASEICDEVGSLLLSLDLEHGEKPLARLDVWHGSSGFEGVVEKLREEYGKDVVTSPLDSLPPVSEGLARRYYSPPFTLRANSGLEGKVDLVPRAWRTAVDAARLKKQVVTGIIILFGVWLLGMTLLGLGYQSSLKRVKRIEERMAGLQEPSDEVRALQRQVNSFEQYLDRKWSALECLREISSLLPPDVSLTSFQFKKGKNVVVRGESQAVEPIIDFNEQLVASPLFGAVDMGAIQPRKRKDQTVQTFQMNIAIPEQDQ